MRLIKLLPLLFLFPVAACAADTIVQSDKLKFGRKASTAVKEFEIEQNAGANNPKIDSTSAGLEIRLKTAKVKKGKGTNANIVDEFDIGSATNPGTRWNSGTSKLEFTHDGTTFTEMGASSVVQDWPYELTNVGLSASVAANAMTIRLKQKDGTTDPAASNASVKISFKNSTAATGGYTSVTTTSAVSTVISSGSTAGAVAAQPNWLYVYALNNAGTLELAWSGSNTWDEGVLQSTTAEGGAGAADSKNVLYSTTARSGVAVRLLGRVKSTQATPGTWATAPSEVSVTPVERNFARSEVWVYGPNGYGATNNKVPRFLTIGKNVGPDVTYAESASDGASFTVNSDGIYLIFYTDQINTQGVIGISINSTQLTTSIVTITAADAFCTVETALSAANATCAAATILKAGDVIRPHTDGATRTNTFGSQFRVTKISN